MLRFVPQTRARVLEIGCATGSFISSLDNCLEKWGVEPSGAAMLAELKLTKVLHGQFDDVKDHLPKQYFDVVICNDVIEHMANHWAFFSEIADYIAPGGMLIGSIPNVRYYSNLFRFLFEKDWQYQDSGILDKTHLAFFTEKSLRQTIEGAGFDLITITGINYAQVVENTLRSRVYLLLAKALGKLTLGYFSDILCLQFAFQAVPRKGREKKM
jgi:2-polyprenyl-3-methyl-5-hydroxy-6-metoxy-1,4-benzoquinol methylase